MRRHALAFVFLPALALYVACGDDASTPTTELDAGTDASSPVDATTNDVIQQSDTGTDAGGDTGNLGDTGAEAGPPVGLSSCKAIHAAAPTLPSGVYLIDSDGAGSLPLVPAYCDMTFDGGGWTLLESLPEWASGPNSLLSPPADAGTLDAGPDGAWLVRPPAPGVLGAWSGPQAKSLADAAIQVHVRTPFTVDAGVPGGAFITSTLLPDGGGSLPMQNLRALLILNAFQDGGVGDWTGTFANGARLNHSLPTGLCPIDSMTYPWVYWACSNQTGLHIAGGGQEWDFENPQLGTPHDPFEIYVR